MQNYLVWSYLKFVYLKTFYLYLQILINDKSMTFTNSACISRLENTLARDFDALVFSKSGAFYEEKKTRTVDTTSYKCCHKF